MFEDVFRFALFLDDAVGHEDDPVGDFLGEGHFMGDDDHGHVFIGELFDSPQDFAGQFRVEGTRRFVEEHDVRVHGQGAGNGHTLLLAAGEARRIGIAFVPEADFLQEFFGLGHDVFGLHLLDDARRFQDVIQNGHVREEVEVLEAHAHAAADGPDFGCRGIDGAVAAFGRADHGPAVDDDGTAVNRFQLAETAQEGTLAAARRADNGNDFPRFNVKGDVFQDFEAAEGLMDMIHFNKAHDNPPYSS